MMATSVSSRKREFLDSQMTQEEIRERKKIIKAIKKRFLAQFLRKRECHIYNYTVFMCFITPPNINIFML